MNTRQIYGALTVSCALALAACGGGGGGAGESQAVPPAAEQINTSNYTQAAGAAAAQMKRGAELVQVAAIVLQPGIKGIVQSSFACAQGGTLTLLQDASGRVFTAQDCRVGDLLLISGSLTERVNTSGVETAISFNGLNYRNTAIDATANTLSNAGGFGLTVDSTGKLSRASALVDMNRKGVLEAYSIAFNFSSQTDGWSVAATTAGFPYRINAQENPVTKAVKVYSRADGSQLTYTPSADGSTYLIELVNKTQTLSKTVSKAEFDSWVKAAGG